MRIQKFLAKAEIASLRKSEIYIKQGLVKINDEIAAIGQKINPNDKVYFKNRLVIFKNTKEYYILNKPKKYVTTTSDNFNRPIVVDLINTKSRIYPVGRLDYDTTGLLILTNDGDLTYKLTHPKFEIERVYIATLDTNLNEQEMELINSNHFKINQKISKQKVEKISDRKYKVIISQGWYHHVKRMFAEFNKKVIELERVKYSFLEIGSLKIGEYKKLTPDEVSRLKKLFD
ncbi:23S rRNA pseudouridine2605 synthase [Mycoplasma testudineum]|uniref:Pseudouridine synthase n=1 Tax=Mycoplasma testudineum TaxID=244584 RepID=A0A4V3C336_9MOLU|nr:pseudouridine synthase [Mycoplasma testudineum]OYD27001.1 pseudouridine synthase [Mycoplasma testudineum]TDO20549.1 23S rRNA pseudouridine2605 synthase [Mycoplasma testudineum]